MVEISLLIYILGIVAVILIILILVMVIPKKGKIENVVREMFKRKKSLREVLTYGKMKKWSEREVKLYYLLFSMQRFLNQGYSIDEIKSMAEDNKWPKDLIDIVANKLR